MAITDKDRELMRQVAQYFESTEKTDANDKKRKYKLKRDDSRSVNDTAAHFNITRSKATKMLITMGVYETQISKEAQELRRQGLSVRDIAEALGVSVATVSSNLPYEDEIHGGADVSDHAKAMREYRAYERKQRDRQVQVRAENKENKEGKEMGKKKDAKKGLSKRRDVDNKDDWKKDLDSKMSFTETPSRRPRLTYEMIEESGILEERKATLETAGLDMTPPDYEAEYRALREKENLTPDEVRKLGEFPGALYDRNPLALKEIYGEDLPFEPSEMLRLHLELLADFTGEEEEIMHQYGGMEGETISRDIVVSDDLPLYALHYVIQRAFGWQNSHSHRFYLSEERTRELTETVEDWKDQVGVFYRSPLMDQRAEFWADDYEGGSFKNWLRTKYTGPCVSQCREEGLIGCRESIAPLDLDAEYYVEYGSYRDFTDAEDGDEDTIEALPLFCQPVRWNGRKLDPPHEKKHLKKYRVEVEKLRDIPMDLLNWMFERGPFDLLERLPIGQVLVPRCMHCTDDFGKHERISSYQEMVDDYLPEEVYEILDDWVDSPDKQPFVYSFTDELFYQYDFGDNWKIRITASRNCADLVESGKITQDMLDKSNIKARVTYRPVLIARDGEMLIDDVGGTSGFVRFIEAVNTMERGERDENGMTKSELKDWAKSQGWHKGDSSDFNLL